MIYIETERLRLRDWELKDLESFQRMNRDFNVRAFFVDILSNERSEQAFHWMQNEIEQHGIGLFAVEEKTSNNWIGFIGMQYLYPTRQFDMPFMPCYEIGWRLIHDAWNKGYATEGAKAVLKYAREKDIEECCSFTSVLNTKSIHVMEKIGLSYSESFDHPLIDKDHPLCPHVLYRQVKL